MGFLGYAILSERLGIRRGCESKEGIVGRVSGGCMHARTHSRPRTRCRRSVKIRVWRTLIIVQSVG
jgi:hypothetical protein